MSYIPYGRQNIDQLDVDAVSEVLKSDYLTQGPAVPMFEQKLKNYCKVDFAVAANSATSALHLAYLALGVGKGDLVWCPAITFVATSNAALYCEANIDFVDIDSETFNINIQLLKEKLKIAEFEGKLPKVITAVHMCGQPCDMEALSELSKKYHFYLVEDASHAIGSSYQNLPTGSCQYSDIAVFSFHPVKIITTAEGGVAVTNNQKFAAKMALLRSHGVTRDISSMTNESLGDWYYEQIELGFNYRMTDIQGALGCSQIEKLDASIQRRQVIAQKYIGLMADYPVDLPVVKSNCISSYHLFVVQLRLESTEQNHSAIFKALRNAGIGVNLHYYPVYLQPYYRRFGFEQGYCPVAEKYASCAISLPIFVSITDKEIQYVASSLEKALLA